MARLAVAAFAGGLVQGVGQVEQVMATQARNDLQQLQSQGLSFGVAERRRGAGGSGRHGDPPSMRLGGGETTPENGCFAVPVPDRVTSSEKLNKLRRKGLGLSCAALDRGQTNHNPEEEPPMAFTLPPLPYAYDALEPAIDKETMTFHHDKHHQTYVDNLNKAVDADASLQGKSLEEMFAEMSKLPKAVRNNGGGHWNHSLFWELLAPADQAGAPSAELAAKIDAELGGLDKFKADFDAAGAGQFGSGWAWLILQDGKLKVTSTPNQDNPLMDVADEKGAVLLAADVWEHAYYLKYQNRRVDYLKAFWSVVNWNKVNELYEAAKG